MDLKLLSEFVEETFKGRFDQSWFRNLMKIFKHQEHFKFYMMCFDRVDLLDKFMQNSTWVFSQYDVLDFLNVAFESRSYNVINRLLSEQRVVNQLLQLPGDCFESLFSTLLEHLDTQFSKVNSFRALLNNQLPIVDENLVRITDYMLNVVYKRPELHAEIDNLFVSRRSRQITSHAVVLNQSRLQTLPLMMQAALALPVEERNRTEIPECIRRTIHWGWKTPTPRASTTTSSTTSSSDSNPESLANIDTRKAKRQRR